MAAAAGPLVAAEGGWRRGGASAPGCEKKEPVRPARRAAGEACSRRSPLDEVPSSKCRRRSADDEVPSSRCQRRSARRGAGTPSPRGLDRGRGTAGLDVGRGAAAHQSAPILGQAVLLGQKRQDGALALPARPPRHAHQSPQSRQSRSHPAASAAGAGCLTVGLNNPPGSGQRRAPAQRAQKRTIKLSRERGGGSSAGSNGAGAASAAIRMAIGRSSPPSS